MSKYVERELERVHLALSEPREPAERDRPYAAPQALSWALDPTSVKSPYDMVTGMSGGSEGCSVQPRHSPS